MKVVIKMVNNVKPPARTGVLEFLESTIGAQFVIPVYQRNYTWIAEKEVKQFLKDLNSVLKEKYNNHFLGIIIYLENSIDFSTREFSIIDGQQRLTTLFLLLYSIRGIAKEQGQENIADAIDGQYLINKHVSQKEYEHKLKPQVSDDNVYQMIVQNRVDELKNKKMESKIYKNYNYLLEETRNLNKDFTLNEILMALDKLYLVSIPLSDGDNPQKIFESINATGVKLTASDLIRNFLLMGLNNEDQETYYNRYWLELERLLTKDAKKLESFFRFFLATKYKDLPTIKSIYKLFKEWHDENIDELEVEGIFKELIKYAEYYHSIYYKELYQLEVELRPAISEYRKVLSYMPAPLLMGFYDLYSNDLISTKQLSELIFVINNYLIRRSIADIDTSSITRLFAPLLKNVLEETNESYDNIVDILKRNLVFKNISNSMYTPDDQQLKDMVINANVYKIRGTLRIFFDKLEHDNNPAPVDLSELSIEHLMPQTVSKEWLEDLEVNEEEYQKHINKLGNLTLATKSDNSRMQNNPWRYKNKILSGTSHLKINEVLLQKEKWNIEEINKRTIKLIEEFNRLFPYPQPSSSAIRKMDIFIDFNGIKASGSFYVDNGNVEIFEGSELTGFERAEDYPDTENFRKKLIEEGVISIDGESAVFKKSRVINSLKKNSTALSAAASAILHGSRNGWDVWKDSNGKSLNEHKELVDFYG